MLSVLMRQAGLTGNTMKHFLNPQRGIATLEILIAMVIIVLAITAVMPLIFSSQGSAVSSQTYQEALYKAQAALENTRVLDFSLVASQPAKSDGFYTSSITVVPDANLATKQISSQVTWASSQVTLSTTVTDPFSAAGVCNPSLSNPEAWKTPQVYPAGNPPGFPTTELVSQSPLHTNANGLGIADIKVYRQKLYLAANKTAGSDTHTLYIANLPGDPTMNPQFSGWASTIGGTLSAITVAPYQNKLYAYTANAFSQGYSKCQTNKKPDPSKCAQLQVIEVTDPANPSVLQSANILIAATDSSNTLAAGKSIFYNQGYIYLGLTIASGSGAEFNIIDVGGGSGSPTNPVLVGSYQVGNTINSIFVKNGFAYIATTDRSNGKGLLVLDVSTPNHPTLKWSNIFGSSFGIANSFGTTSNPLYFGMTYNASNPELYILNNSNPSSQAPTVAKGLNIGGTEGINGIAVRSNLLFLTTSNQFQIWNIADLNAMYPWTPGKSTSEFLSLSTFGANGASESSSCVGSYLYVGAAFKDVGGNAKDVIAIIGPSVPPTFDYSFASTPDVSLARGLSTSQIITIAMTPGATPQTVTLTPDQSNFPNGVTISPTWASCTPTITSPYQCQVTFTYSATATADTTGAPTITITGSSPLHPTTFKLTVTKK